MMKLKLLKKYAARRPYAHIRPRFKSGDVIAQSHGSFKSWREFKTMMVRVFTLSTYSHVGVIDVDETDGRVYVVEAVIPAVHRVPLSTIGSFYHLPTDAHWTETTDRFVSRVLGTSYSQWAAIKAYFAPLPPGTVSECAALTAEILIRAGIDLGVLRRPDCIVQACLARGARMTFVEQEEWHKKSSQEPLRSTLQT